MIGICMTSTVYPQQVEEHTSKQHLDASCKQTYDRRMHLLQGPKGSNAGAAALLLAQGIRRGLSPKTPTIAHHKLL